MSSSDVLPGGVEGGEPVPTRLPAISGGSPRILISAAVLDAAAITIFILIGRTSHAEGLAPVGVLETLWPFLAGAAVGWSIAYVYSHVHSSDLFGHDFRPDRVVPAGIVIWFCAVTIGMIMRYLLHQGTAPSFILVATLTLGFLLLGWRLLAGYLIGRSTGPLGPN